MSDQGKPGYLFQTARPEPGIIRAEEIAAKVKAEASKLAKARFQGKKNIYTCQACFEHIVTVDLDDGVTPFMINCRCTEGCKGMMQSSMYRVFDQTMRAGFEWYKPASSADLPPGSREHVEQGGLLLRKVGAKS
jgi:hypothetical protein